MEKLQIEYISINELIPCERNPRNNKDNIGRLEKSIEHFGWTNPILARKENKQIIAGHTRLEAAKEKGLTEVPVIYLDMNEADALSYMLADNKLTERVGWDEELLSDIFKELKTLDFELELTGFDFDEIAVFTEEEKEGLTDEDEVPDEVEAITKAGDLWLLGEHRLLCGDSTKKEDVEKLMDGKKADMVLTDPPYGIGFKYNTHKDITGDEYISFCEEWFSNIKRFADFIIISTGWNYNRFWFNKEPTDCFYWLCKNKRTGGKISHFRKVEPIFIWGKPANKYNFDFWEQTTEIEKDLVGQHTCPKPVSLITSILEGINSNTIVLDVFLGSGTTLIACEKTNRVCYGIEKDTHYCDVIIKRWENYTGEKAVKVNE